MKLKKVFTGEYLGSFYNEKLKGEDGVLSLKYLTGNMYSMTFSFQDMAIKLSAVLHEVGDLHHVFITEKFDEEYHIQGNANLSVHEGVHGCLDSGEMDIQFIFNKYNERSFKVSFSGSKKNRNSDKLNSNSLIDYLKMNVLSDVKTTK